MSLWYSANYLFLALAYNNRVQVVMYEYTQFYFTLFY